jgi:hypothetical protein
MITLLSVLFTVLNIADLVITLLLMNYFQNNIEGNPIASLFYHQYGAVGMMFHKLIMTSIVLSISYYLNNVKPRYSFLVLVLGCLILLPTVCYSLQMYYDRSI